MNAFNAFVKSMIYRNNYGLFIFVTIAVTLNCGCSPYIEISRTENKLKKIIEETDSTSIQNYHIWRNINEKRLLDYSYFAETNEQNIDSIKQYRKYLIQVAKEVKRDTTQDELSKKKILESVYYAKQSSNEIRRTYRGYRGIISTRVVESAESLQDIISECRLCSKTVCFVADIGKIECVPFSTIIATYNTDFGSMIIQDANQLYEIYGIDFADEFLFECGMGYWGGGNSEDLNPGGSPGTGQMVPFKAGVIDLCQAIRDAVNSNANAIGSGGNFSGVTGFDPYNLFECNNMNAEGNYIENLVSQVEDASNNCEMGEIETFMDGPNDQPDPPDPPPTIVDEAPPRTVYNQDGTISVIERTEYSDGSVKEWVTTYDSDMVEIERSLNTWSTDEMGNRDGTYTTWYANGDYSHHWSSSEQGSDIIHINGYTRSGGITEREAYRIHGDKVYKHVNQNNWQRIKHSQDCIDESCTACNTFVENIAENLESYIHTEGRAWANTRYAEHGGDCCSNQDGFSGDPRLVLPNPLGDFYCSGESDFDSRRQRCELMCQFASSEDCFSNCMSYPESEVYRFNVWDRVCRYAISDECFSGEADFPIYTPDLTMPPLPIPTLYQENAIFPLIDFRPPEIQLPDGFDPD